jgi:hemerythrin-like domain-containing protein
LDHRAGLPPELRVLLDAYPRAEWEGHANFDGLVRFWLDRHGMFRAVLGRMRDGAEAVLDGKADPLRHRTETARYVNLLLGELHGHHQIEDHHYFPKLAHLDARLTRGFDLLDADHHDLDGHMKALARSANDYLQAAGDTERVRAGDLREALVGFETFLDRHLTDEEDLIVPVILKHAPPL